MNGTSFAAMSCSCPKICCRLAWSELPCSWATQLVRLRVLVAVLEEATVDQERRQVVVGVRVVREPAEEPHVVGALLVDRLVLVPLGALQGHLEQPAGLQLALDLVRLVLGVGAVVGGRPSDGEVDRRADAGRLQDLLGLGDVGRAVRRLVGVLLTAVARGHDGVQRVDGVVVGVLRDGLAVEDLGRGLADGRLLADAARRRSRPSSGSRSPCRWPR